MGSPTDYPNVPEWTRKDTGYQAGEMVKYQGNVFKASYWAGEAPGADPGWAIYDEMYDLTSKGVEQAKIIAYIPTWRKGGFNYSNDEMYCNITHGIISFLEFSESSLGEFNPVALEAVNAIIKEVVTVGHSNGVRISIAIGGAVDYGFLYLMEKIGNNPSDPLLDQVVQRVASFVRANNLDGVDLDLECWWAKDGSAGGDQGGRPKGDGPHPAGRGLAEFARKLKEAMPNKIVSTAVFATSWYGNNYDPALIHYVDWIGIMSYDLTGSWNQSPVGPQTAAFKIRNQQNYMAEQQGPWPSTPRGPGEESDPISDNPIFSMEDSIWYWTNPFFMNWQGPGQRIPRNKIAGGVPIYGYDFAYPKTSDDKSGQVPPGYKTVRYSEILTAFPDAHTATNANIKVEGSTPRPPFISAPGNYPYTNNIYFETPGTAVAKLNFLKAVGTQGVIIWELSNDVWEEGKSIIKALYKNSGNPANKPPILVEKPPIENPPDEETSTWMSRVLGKKLLSELTIPGTHETCATTASHPAAIPWTRCQDRSLWQQLNAGIRFIDIRCRHIGDTFTIHHGAEYQNIVFDDVLTQCIDFLNINTQECIVMLVKFEYKEENCTRSYEATFDSYVERNKNMWYLGDTIPTLDEVRGKIVLVRRFALDERKGTDSNGNPKPITRKKGIDASFPLGEEIGTRTFEIKNNAHLHVQDEYNLKTTVGGGTVPVPVGDFKWKLDKISWLLERAKSGSSNTWYINYASGLCNPWANPGDVAISINPKLREKVKEQTSRCGTVLMDFPSDDDIKALISRNNL